MSPNIFYDGGGPPLNKGHYKGAVHEKIFKLISMKNHLLHDFMGENGPFLVLEWH